MILGALLTIFKWIALFVISLLPKFPDYSGEISSALEPMMNVLKSVNTFVDLGLFSTCLVIVFVISNIELIYNMVMWIVRKIPGVS